MAALCSFFFLERRGTTFTAKVHFCLIQSVSAFSLFAQTLPLLFKPFFLFFVVQLISLAVCELEHDNLQRCDGEK